MPRRSGARTSSSPRAAPSRSAAPAPQRAPAPPPPPPPAPAAAPPPPMPAQQGGGMMSGMMGSMASGMAAGVGMSVASRAVDSMMGPRQTEVVHRNEGQPAAAPAAAPPVADKCMNERDWLKQCHGQSQDPTNCNYYADLLKQCQAA